MTDPIDPVRRIGYTGDAPGASKEPKKFSGRERQVSEPAEGYDLRDIAPGEVQQFLDLQLMKEAERWDVAFKMDRLQKLKEALQRVQNGTAIEVDLAILSQAKTTVSEYDRSTYTRDGRVPATHDDLKTQIDLFHALGQQLKPSSPSIQQG